MKTLLRGAFASLILACVCLASASPGMMCVAAKLVSVTAKLMSGYTYVISAANTSGASLPLAQNSFAQAPTSDGENNVSIDVGQTGETWSGSGGMTVYFAPIPTISTIQYPTLRPINNSDITQFSNHNTNGITSGVSDQFATTVNGAGTIYVVAPSGFTGQVTVTIRVGPGGNAFSLNNTLKSGNASLAAILSALGTPFQVGGSIGNTAFTANAGTNLNTSLLALETGGNLATAATRLTTIASNGATASNQTSGAAQTKITDGTNIAGVVPGIVNGVTSNSGMVQYTLSSTGAQSANTPIPITVSGDATRNPTSTTYIDTTGYSSVAVTVVSIGSGVTNIERYGANRTSDTFYPESISNISSSSGSSIGVTMGSTATIYTGGLASRFLQFQTNGVQSSGTTTIIVTLRSTGAYQPVVQLAQGSNPIGGLAAVTSGGMSSYAPIAGLPSSPTVIKGSAGSLYTVDIYNPNATIEYVALLFRDNPQKQPASRRRGAFRVRSIALQVQPLPAGL